MKKFLLGVIITLIIVAIGAGGWFIYNNQKDSNDEIANLKQEIADLKGRATENRNKESKSEYESNTNEPTSENVNTTNGLTISDVVGSYDNEKDEMNYKSLNLYDNGVFEYYNMPNLDCHYEGYYVIDNNKIKLYCILECANDPGAGVVDEIFEVKYDNGTVSFDNEVMKKTNASIGRYREEGVNISNSIKTRLDNGYLN